MPAELSRGSLNGFPLDHYDDDDRCPSIINMRSSFIKQAELPTSGHIVAGVLLADDRGLGREQTTVVLGSVVFERTDMTVEQLRKIILSQMPSLSGNFVFLTKEGWPIQRDQEKIVKLLQILTNKLAIVIRKHFEKSRAGIVTSAGTCLGFIFIDIHTSVRQIRDCIDEQLKEHKPLKNEYRFIERNGWPVTRTQENVLAVTDILVASNIHIELGNSITEHASGHLMLPPPPVPAIKFGPGIDVIDWTRGRKKSQKPSNFSIRKNTDESRIVGPIKNLVAKPILLSYVRAEAAQHALELKIALSDLGFSVYLDVHEIKTGCDWQDALNYAVANCRVFVPLITPMYGKTQWTNREVKLADVLNKFIIPVNFLDHWPPECLAIQFASTQYVPSKLGEEKAYADLDRHADFHIWDNKQIKRVSEEISSHIAKEKPPPKPQTFSPDIVDNCKIGKLPEERSQSSHFVVISAHPKQLLLAHQLKKTFEEEGYSVWCSIHMLDGQDNADLEQVPTPRDLPTIPEEQEHTHLGRSASTAFTYDNRHNRLSKVDTADVISPSYDKKSLVRLSSQYSDISQVSFSLTSEKITCLKAFQEKVDHAGVVIVLVSEAYTKSRTSQQQVFYCEHRKKLVLVKCDHSNVPTWFSMLMGNDMLANVNSPQFETSIKARVKRALDPSTSSTPKDATAEAKMQYLVTFMKKNLPIMDSYVYVAGASKFQNPRSEEICKAIGRALAKVKNLTIVTGGFYGAGDIVAQAFMEVHKNNMTTLFTTENSPVVHIVPVKDSQDFSQKAKQNLDGSFENVPYGKTMFLGDSVKERETAVARLFDTCIVIEGGPGAAHEVEQFIWNDHFVIPIISTGGAACGQFGVPLQMLEIPPCVTEADWCTLSEKEATPEEVANAVVNIVVALKRAMASHAYMPNYKYKTKGKSRLRRKSKRKSRKKDLEAAEQNSQSELLSSPRMDKHDHLAGVDSEGDDMTCSGPGRWRKIFRIFSTIPSHRTIDT